MNDIEFMNLKDDLYLMIESARRCLDVNTYKRCKESAEEIEKLIDLATPKDTDKSIFDDEEFHDRCPNCGCFVFGKFCHICGQAIVFR